MGQRATPAQLRFASHVALGFARLAQLTPGTLLWRSTDDGLPGRTEAMGQLNYRELQRDGAQLLSQIDRSEYVEGIYRCVRLPSG
jgi:hypothetical protein